MNRYNYDIDEFNTGLEQDLNQLKEQRIANHYINNIMNMHNNLLENMKTDQKYSNFEKVCEIYNRSGNKHVNQETKKKVLEYIENNGITDMSYTMQLLYDVQNGKVNRIEYKLQKN
jgi:hypothetical protein